MKSDLASTLADKRCVVLYSLCQPVLTVSDGLCISICNKEMLKVPVSVDSK